MPTQESPGTETRTLTLITREPQVPQTLPRHLDAWEARLDGQRTISAPDDPYLAVEYDLSFPAGGPVDGAVLRESAEAWGVDLVLMPTAAKHSRRRLVAFDMDSTLIQCEVIDELAARAGVGDAVAAVTARAMRGELDFKASFRERMARLRGLEESALEAVAAELPLMPGVERLLRGLIDRGHYTVILSGGFDYFARRLQQQLGFHEVHANRLHIDGGALTGEVVGEIVDGERKVALLRGIAEQQGIPMQDVVAVGDGANDLPMLAAAGLGVAYHAKPLVRERAPHAMSFSGLDGLLYLLEA